MKVSWKVLEWLIRLGLSPRFQRLSSDRTWQCTTLGGGWKRRWNWRWKGIKQDYRLLGFGPPKGWRSPKEIQ
jgi:hypothetical protein